MKIPRLTQCISLVAASLVLSGAVCAADKPAQLSDTQLDNVTAGTAYISYGALQGNYVPGKGQVSNPANSYTRGCSVLTYCSR